MSLALLFPALVSAGRVMDPVGAKGFLSRYKSIPNAAQRKLSSQMKIDGVA